MLFQIYGDKAGYQLLGWLLVFLGLILTNEIARRTKKGGIFFFLALPGALTVYFIAVAVGAAMGAGWAENNPTYLYMNSWFHYAKLYAATIGCIGFMMIKYQWGIGKKDWFKPFPFVIVAINILIAVGSDFESAIKGALSVVAVQRKRLAVRRLVELAQRHCRPAEHLLHDRLVGHLLLQKEGRYALAGHDLAVHSGL